MIPHLVGSHNIEHSCNDGVLQPKPSTCATITSNERGQPTAHPLLAHEQADEFEKNRLKFKTSGRLLNHPFTVEEFTEHSST